MLYYLASGVLFSDIGVMRTTEMAYASVDPVCGLQFQLCVIGLTSTENTCRAVPRYCTLCAGEKCEIRIERFCCVWGREVLTAHCFVIGFRYICTFLNINIRILLK